MSQSIAIALSTDPQAEARRRLGLQPSTPQGPAYRQHEIGDMVIVAGLTAEGEVLAEAAAAGEQETCRWIAGQAARLALIEGIMEDLD